MIRAAHDFSLCTRRPQSCSLHATCARAQLGSADHARQRWCAPLLTGEACDIYHPFDPSRIAAANGTISAESENLGRSEQSGAAHREDAGGSGSAVKLPARNEDRAGHGVEVAGAGLSSAPAFPDLLSAGEHQQLRAARLLNL